MTGTTTDTQYPERPRRARRLGLALLVCTVPVLAAGGWFGWQALADGSRPGAAPPASSGLAADPTPASSDPEAAGASAAAPSSGPAPSNAVPSASAPTGSGPLNGRTVLLDPGHNPGNVKHTTEINRQVDIGNARKECDTTGTSTNAGYSEASYTLDVVHRAREILRQRGASVVLTQDGDRPFGPCIDERARIGNQAKADAAVSVHADGAPAGAHGFHVIMPGKVTAGPADTSAIVDPSHRLGVLLRDDFRQATGQPYADYIGKDGLDTRTDLGGLNLSRVPKVFIECGNMRNAADAQHMTDPQWRQKAAEGIAEAVTAFLAGGS
ncbi:N-acetylmuramoyl-L-alanine amidase [Streptomyces sp. TLI_235]|nr:N-acetylmuramoyl-L-alanine amidase [Streptomyces sp. TLI_235]PBC80078.1 N-acetylmuramoyl-L-alanine amidase [Streptomyces sp. TLI_235]